MNIDAYRKKTMKAVERAAAHAEDAFRAYRDGKRTAGERLEAISAAGPLREDRDIDYAIGIAGDRKQAPKTRAMAIGHLVSGLGRSTKAIALLIDTLGDRTEDADVRGAAANALKAAAFQVRGFSAHRAAYISALRSASEAGDGLLRLRVLGVLAREKDAPTLKRLEQGLRDGKRVLVDPEKALQLLSYDPKRDTRDLLEEIIKRPPTPGARHQALRNLAYDVGYKPQFSRIARDKKADRESRLIALSAIHSIDPKGLGKLAIDLATDNGEDETIRGACLTAMTTLWPPPSSPVLREIASRLAEKGRSKPVREAARLYLVSSRA